MPASDDLQGEGAVTRDACVSSRASVRVAELGGARLHARRRGRAAGDERRGARMQGEGYSAGRCCVFVDAGGARAIRVPTDAWGGREQCPLTSARKRGESAVLDMGVSRSDRPARRPRKGLASCPPPAGSRLRPRRMTQTRREISSSRRKASSCAALTCIRTGVRRCCKPGAPVTWSRSRASTARAFTASLRPGTASTGSRPWPLSLPGATAEPCDPRCGELRPRA